MNPPISPRFPSNPNIGDKFTTPDGRTFEWNGHQWVLVSTPGGGGTGIGEGGFQYHKTPADTDWSITHNLGHRYVLVQVVDTAQNTVIPDVIYTSTTHVHLVFANPVAGTAIIRR